MKIIKHIELVCKVYHDEPVMRLRYLDDEKFEESSLYSVGEINNILHLRKLGDLLGSFGIGTKLAENFTFQLTKD